jgi:hypothetical protein
MNLWSPPASYNLCYPGVRCYFGVFSKLVVLRVSSGAAPSCGAAPGRAEESGVIAVQRFYGHAAGSGIELTYAHIYNNRTGEARKETEKEPTGDVRGKSASNIAVHHGYC